MDIWKKFEYEYQGRSLVDDANPVLVRVRDYVADDWSESIWRLQAIIVNEEKRLFIAQEFSKLVRDSQGVREPYTAQKFNITFVKDGETLVFRYVDPVNGL